MATQGADEGPSQTGEPSSDASTTHTESDDSKPDRPGTASEYVDAVSEPAAPDAEPLPEWTTAEPDPYLGPGLYASYDVVTPQTYRTGRYQVSRVPPPTQPPDPILPFIAPPVARKRRSDWPVLLVALIISAIVLAACCIAGYVLYLSNGTLFS
jgi:hypothetical protein